MSDAQLVKEGWKFMEQSLKENFVINDSSYGLIDSDDPLAADAGTVADFVLCPWPYDDTEEETHDSRVIADSLKRLREDLSKKIAGE